MINRVILLCWILIVACDSSSTEVLSDLGVDATVPDAALDVPNDEGIQDLNKDSPAAETTPDTAPDLLVPDAVATCYDCHGSPSSPAPPVDTTGVSATTARGVGAHQQHLGASSWHAEIQCEDCHQVPTDVGDPGHIDTPLPAELTFSALARTDSASPSFDGTSCAGTYCHGSTLSGGTASAPEWTKVDGTQTGCDGCHGMPPAGDHPQRTNCSLCHSNATASQTIIDPDLHINGTVEVSDMACDSCHGSVNNAAPPVSTTGEAATTARGVGAHQQHLGASSWHAEIQCNDCHVVPAKHDDPGHRDTPLPAELTFSQLAKTDGASPAFDGTSCGNTYCHGSTLSGGTASSPVWTTVNGTQSTCNSCHGMPPAGGHIQNNNCSLCHDNVTASQTIIDPALHIDGKVDVGDMACNACHGSGSNDAPPVSTTGEVSTTARGVGAHQQHLGSSSWHATIQCSDCHKVPASYDAPGHIDTALPAELTFSALARSDGANNPSFNGVSCTGTYCHGSTLSGGATTAPIWTKVDGTQSACDSCHGVPPGNGHPQENDCSLCHDSVDANQNIITPAVHINGQVEANGECVDCHDKAQDNGDNIPPGGRRAVVSEFPTNPAHAHAATVDSDSCIVCHDTSTHMSGTVRLLDPDGGANYTFQTVDDLASDPDLSNFCANCHDADGAARLGSPQDPFGSGKAPQDVATRFLGTLSWTEQYGNDGCFSAEGTQRHVNAHHDISDADQAQSGAKVECLSCHGAHLPSAAQKLADPADPLLPWTGANTPFCLRCHAGGTDPANPALPQGVTGPAIAMRGLESCGYQAAPWYVDYTWTHSPHGPDSKRGWPGYSGAPGADLQCTVCHDPHGSYSATNTLGNPYMIRDWVDGTSFVDDGTRTSPNGPPWDTTGIAREVVVGVSGAVVDWGGATGLCNVCHADWVAASSPSHGCSSCQTCHGHGQSWDGHDWGGSGSNTPCP